MGPQTPKLEICFRATQMLSGIPFWTNLGRFRVGIAMPTWCGQLRNGFADTNCRRARDLLPSHSEAVWDPVLDQFGSFPRGYSDVKLVWTAQKWVRRQILIASKSMILIQKTYRERSLSYPSVNFSLLIRCWGPLLGPVFHEYPMIGWYFVVQNRPP